MDICSPLVGLCLWPVNQPITPAGVRSGRSNSFFDSLTYLYCSKFSVKDMYCSKFSVQNSLNKRFTWIQRYNEVQHNATSQDTVLYCNKNASLARNALKCLLNKHTSSFKHRADRKYQHMIGCSHCSRLEPIINLYIGS